MPLGADHARCNTIASTGAGKSYTASVLIEEMLRLHNRAAILVIDPHGEYDTLAGIANQPALRGEGYTPQAAIKKPGTVKVRVGSLTMADLRYLLPNISERMEYVLQRARLQAECTSRNRTGNKDADRWILAELLGAVEAVGITNQRRPIFALSGLRAYGRSAQFRSSMHQYRNHRHSQTNPR